ncbi:unnamed protein product, partial [Durusdinium trenchii]
MNIVATKYCLEYHGYKLKFNDNTGVGLTARCYVHEFGQVVGYHKVKSVTYYDQVKLVEFRRELIVPPFYPVKVSHETVFPNQPKHISNMWKKAPEPLDGLDDPFIDRPVEFTEAELRVMVYYLKVCDLGLDILPDGMPSGAGRKSSQEKSIRRKLKSLCANESMNIVTTQFYFNLKNRELKFQRTSNVGMNTRCYVYGEGEVIGYHTVLKMTTYEQTKFLTFHCDLVVPEGYPVKMPIELVFPKLPAPDPGYVWRKAPTPPEGSDDPFCNEVEFTPEELRSIVFHLRRSDLGQVIPHDGVYVGGHSHSQAESIERKLKILCANA